MTFSQNNYDNSKKITEILFSKDTKETYEKFKKLEHYCHTSRELYTYFDQYIEALNSNNGCVRGRGFKLIIRNAQWDDENKINGNLDKILAVLDDDKPTVVRQCLAVLPLIGPYKKELLPQIKEKLTTLNYLKYKESMQGLIKKDIEAALNSFR